MNVPISTTKSINGWIATCGTVEATRKRKDDAITACKQAVRCRLAADTRMPRVIPALAADRVFVVIPDPDGGTLIVSVNTLTGMRGGLTSSSLGFDAECEAYRRHAKAICGDTKEVA